MVSIISTQLCCCSTNAATHKSYINGHRCVLIRNVQNICLQNRWWAIFDPQAIVFQIPFLTIAVDCLLLRAWATMFARWHLRCHSMIWLLKIITNFHNFLSIQPIHKNHWLLIQLLAKWSTLNLYHHFNNYRPPNIITIRALHTSEQVPNGKFIWITEADLKYFLWSNSGNWWLMIWHQNYSSKLQENTIHWQSNSHWIKSEWHCLETL